MAIDKITNVASVTYDGEQYSSLAAETLLQFPPLITKAVDKNMARIGDTLSYTITITNQSSELAITDLLFEDTIPTGTEYVEDSFTVDGNPAEPVIEEGVISYDIASIDPSGEVVIEFDVLIVGD